MLMRNKKIKLGKGILNLGREKTWEVSPKEEILSSNLKKMEKIVIAFWKRSASEEPWAPANSKQDSG